LGHEMSSETLPGSAHAQVLVNAVSIPTTDPIRVLSYEAGADAVSSAWVRTLVDAGVTSRKVRFTTATPETIESENLYAQYDVCLVHGATGSDPAALGARWATSLAKFTKKGGVFIGLDGGLSDMPALVNATGLLAVSSHVALPSTTHFFVAGASDVVGAHV